MRGHMRAAAAATAVVVTLATAGGAAGAAVFDAMRDAAETPTPEDVFAPDPAGLTNGGCREVACVRLDHATGGTFGIGGFTYRLAGGPDEGQGVARALQGDDAFAASFRGGPDGDLGGGSDGDGPVHFTYAGSGRLDDIVAPGAGILPVPASLALLIGALIGLGFLSHRRPEAGWAA